MPPQRKRLIRASELAQHAYCARAWWLGSVMGVPAGNTRELDRGEAAHAKHGRQVHLSRVLNWIALALIALAVAALALFGT